MHRLLLVHNFLEYHSDTTPDKIALVCDGQRLNYRQIDNMANRLAKALRDRGVRRGDRVVLLLPNTVDLVVGIFGVLKAGGVFVVLHPTTPPDKLAFIVQDCAAAALITRAMQVQAVDYVQRSTSSLRVVILTEKGASQAAAQRAGVVAMEVLQQEYAPTRPPRLNIDQDLACLVYTSGSTGEPKGVMAAHSNVVFATGSIISYLQNTPDDVVINVLPMSFDYGLYQLLMVFRFGGTLLLERSFTFPVEILKKMASEKVTGFPGVPTIFAMLLQMDLSRYDLSHLRYVTNTAAALATNQIQGIRAMLPWVTLYSMYGLTETKRTLYLPPDQLDARPDSVGIAIPGTEVWLEDKEGTRLGPHQVGELVIRGRHVMRGYWGDPEASAKRFRPGPLPGETVCYSGDLFRQDEEGYLYFVGREDDIIKSRGEKVAPREIENVLFGLPGVAEAAVIGVPDPMLGQAIKAFIVPNGQPLGEQEVLAHCRSHLESLMVPQIIEFRGELPKTANGKVNKKELA